MPALGQPGRAKPRPAHRPKLETVEKIVQHAGEYIQQVTEGDPKGDELRRTAVARHTARLRQRRHVPDGGELTVLPAAVEAVSRTRTYRPRIVVQPADVQAEMGAAAEVELSVQAQVRGAAAHRASARSGGCTRSAVSLSRGAPS